MDISLDIETLGTEPGCVILSIGAVAFNRETGEVGKSCYIGIDIQSSRDLGLTIDTQTLKWWAEQNDVARLAAFSGLETPRNAAMILSSFVLMVQPEFIWAKPPSFDVTLIEHLLGRVRVGHPWDHRQPRDCRTLFHATGVKQPDYGTPHHPVDDAISQLHGVVAAYARLKQIAA